jgi:nitrile hydratase
MPTYDSDRVGRIHRELHSHLPSDSALRVKALESLLVEKGLLDPRTVDAWIEAYSERIGPKRGAEIVAHAWIEPAFRARLLDDGTEAVKEMSFGDNATPHLKVVENTPAIHNVVVCTLCSCYPTQVLGIPPNWYKSAEYRARIVRDPRGVLAEFGVSLGADTEVRVWDSTAELRYLVLPERPRGTEGWDEARLARVVTRNSMIGTDRDLSPKAREVA